MNSYPPPPSQAGRISGGTPSSRPIPKSECGAAASRQPQVSEWNENLDKCIADLEGAFSGLYARLGPVSQHGENCPPQPTPAHQPLVDLAASMRAKCERINSVTEQIRESARLLEI